MNKDTLAYIFTFLDVKELSKARKVCVDYNKIGKELFDKIVKEKKTIMTCVKEVIKL